MFGCESEGCQLRGRSDVPSRPQQVTCQSFFPGYTDGWEKLQRALKAQIDPLALEKMRGTTSFPFQPRELR